MLREWDAERYHELSDPQFAWGLRVLERVELRGDERVLDAGCGTGRLTAVLRSRVPQGRVTALDLSERMVGVARGTLRAAPSSAHAPPPVDVLCADLLALPFARSFDLVFSTATFHWVLDHERLFGELSTVLAPGGRLTAQCGGGPNLARTLQRAIAAVGVEPFAPHFRDWRPRWQFAMPDVTSERLARAGFTDVRCWLEETPVAFDHAEGHRAFLETVVMRHFLAALPTAALRDRLLDLMTEAALRDDPPLTLDYWRLNIDATRP